MKSFFWRECRYRSSEATISFRFNLWTGKEQVLINGVVISERRNFRLISTHEFSVPAFDENVPYRISIDSGSKGGLVPKVTVYREGVEVYSEESPIFGKPEKPLIRCNRKCLLELLGLLILAIAINYAFNVNQIFIIPNKIINSVFLIIVFIFLLLIMHAVRQRTFSGLLAGTLSLAIIGAAVGVYNNKQYPLLIIKGGLDEQVVLGGRNSGVTVIEITDYACAECNAFYDRIFRSLYDKYIEKEKVQWVSLAIPEASGGGYAARLTACAHGQGAYMDARDYIFEHSPHITRKQAGEFFIEDEEWQGGIFLQCFRTFNESQISWNQRYFSGFFTIRKLPIVLIGYYEGEQYYIYKTMAGVEPFNQYASMIDYLLRKYKNK